MFWGLIVFGQDCFGSKEARGTVVGCLRERRSVLRRIVGKCCLVFNGGGLQDFIAFVSCYDDFFKGGKKRGI